MKFFRAIGSVIEYNQLPAAQRRLTFYSEGRNYWPHLEPLVTGILSESDVPVCYVSSGSNDPGLTLERSNYHPFLIDEGFIRNWFFENIKTDVLVMSMPDLNQFQVKRSRHSVHYVYVQHSLVSLHMIYRQGAFDHFDTVFCGGPHHEREIRATEAHYSLPQKNLVKHGYARLDSIIANARSANVRNSPGLQKHVLIAPSWGPECIIESGIGAQITRQLLDLGHQVTLRPHPQTIKFVGKAVTEISREHFGNPNFSFESNVASQDSLYDSDVMVCDWSGAALDYAFGLKKPVLFVDVPRKVNNNEYQVLGIEPFEASIREKIGTIWHDGDDLILALESLGSKEFTPDDYVFNIGTSGSVGVAYLRNLLG